MRFCVAVWLVIASVGLCGLPAIAQQKEPSQAERLFREAREDMKRQDYAVACPKLAESLKLEAMPGTLLNLSECEEKQGHLVESLKHQRSAISKLPANDERIPAAKEREADLEKRVPLLTVKLRPGVSPGMRVVLDATVLAPEQIGIAIPINPGTHTLRISSQAGERRSQEVIVKEADRQEIVLDPPTVASDGDASEGRGSSPTRTWGYVVGSVGVVGLAVGAAFAIRAKGQDDDARKAPHYYAPTEGGGFCDQTCADRNTDARSSATTSYVALGGGAALIVTGLAMILFAPSGRESPKISIRATAAPNMAGLQMGGVPSTGYVGPTNQRPTDTTHNASGTWGAAATTIPLASLPSPSSNARRAMVAGRAEARVAAPGWEATAGVVPTGEAGIPGPEEREEHPAAARPVRGAARAMAASRWGAKPRARAATMAVTARLATPATLARPASAKSTPESARRRRVRTVAAREASAINQPSRTGMRAATGDRRAQPATTMRSATLVPATAPGGVRTLLSEYE